jgi:hypothetical protein
LTATAEVAAAAAAAAVAPLEDVVLPHSALAATAISPVVMIEAHAMTKIHAATGVLAMTKVSVMADCLVMTKTHAITEALAMTETEALETTGALDSQMTATRTGEGIRGIADTECSSCTAIPRLNPRGTASLGGMPFFFRDFSG